MTTKNELAHKFTVAFTTAEYPIAIALFAKAQKILSTEERINLFYNNYNSALQKFINDHQIPFDKSHPRLP